MSNGMGFSSQGERDQSQKLVAVSVQYFLDVETGKDEEGKKVCKTGFQTNSAELEK